MAIVLGGIKKKHKKIVKTWTNIHLFHGKCLTEYDNDN